MNVLVVDDSDVMRGMIVKSLKKSGISVGDVHEATNGEEGLQSLREHSVDLVFVDLSMPLMDGETFLRNLRGEPTTSGLPVVVVSSGGGTQRADRLESLGACFVQKPFTPQSIRSAVEGAVGVRQ